MQEEGTRVRVMSDSEKSDYQGITVNADGTDGADGADDGGRARDHRTGYSRGGFRVHTTNIPLGRIYTFGGRSSWLTRIAVTVIVAAILAFLVFVALPVALIGVAIGALIYIILKFLGGK